MLPYSNYLENMHNYAQSSVAVECITAFFRFLERNECALDTIAPVDATFALKTGLILSNFNELFLNKSLFAELYQDYLKNKSFDPHRFSIISSVSLFIAMGIKATRLIEADSGKKHDFDAAWGPRHTLEAEIIRLGESDDFTLRSVSPEDMRTDPATSSLLVIDVNPIPNVFNELARNLENFFPTWPHISGVMIYADFWTNDSVGWECQILANKHARRPFDATTLRRFEPLKQRMTLAKQYR